MFPLVRLFDSALIYRLLTHIRSYVAYLAYISLTIKNKIKSHNKQIFTVAIVLGYRKTKNFLFFSVLGIYERQVQYYSYEKFKIFFYLNLTTL